MSLHLQSSHGTSTAPYPVVPGAATVLLIWLIVAAWPVFAVAGDIEPAGVLIGALAFMIIAKAVALWCTGAKARTVRLARWSRAGPMAAGRIFNND